MTSAGMGLLLFDSSFRVLYANSEAVRILAYPGRSPRKRGSVDRVVEEKIRAKLKDHLPSPGSPALTELYSGKRRYLCRAISLGPDSQNQFTTPEFRPSLVVLIERSDRALRELTRISAQYHLTPREQETMESLMHGLTSKQIAARMKISPNTVKTFVRMIMLKMGVTTRSGLVGRLIARER